MRYADFNFYKNEYGGTMPESTFNRLSLEASAFIRLNTFGRIDINNVPEAVKFCTCSIVDKLKKIEKRDGKKAESVGSWSITYEGRESDANSLNNILLQYLSEETSSDGTPLLYRGV